MDQLCSSCSTPIRTQSRFCVKCGLPVQDAAVPMLPPPVPAPVAAARQSAPLVDGMPVSLTVSMTKSWYWIDSEFAVYLDQQIVGRGSLTRGMTAQTTTILGKHTITLVLGETNLHRKINLPLNITRSGEGTVEICYSRMMGNFRLVVT